MLTNNLKKYLSYSQLAPLFGPVVLVIVFFMADGMETKQQSFLAIFASVVYYWLFTNIPLHIPGMIGVSLAVFAQVITPSEALAQFSSPIIYLFWAGFIFAHAMQKHGLDKRLALELLTLKFINGSVPRTVAMVFFITGFFTLWVSNTAVAAMMLPLIMAILHGLKLDHSSFEAKVLLGVAYIASIAGIATPIGSTPNIITLEFLDSIAGVKINFLHWVALNLPLAIIIIIGFTVYTLKSLGKTKTHFDKEFLSNQKKQLPPISIHEKYVAVLFGFTVFAWFLPGIIQPFLDQKSNAYIYFDKYADPGIVGMFMASLLFIFPFFGKEKIQNSHDLNSIDWGTLLLFGSGLALGKILFSTGLANVMANVLLEDAQNMSPFTLYLALAVFSVIFTEFTSNTAAANILLPIVITLCQKLGLSVVGPSLVVGVACSLSFMLPISTPPNALVYATGKVPFKLMAKIGFVMNICVAILIACHFYLMGKFGFMP